MFFTGLFLGQVAIRVSALSRPLIVYAVPAALLLLQGTHQSPYYLGDWRTHLF